MQNVRWTYTYCIDWEQRAHQYSRSQWIYMREKHALTGLDQQVDFSLPYLHLRVRSTAWLHDTAHYSFDFEIGDHLRQILKTMTSYEDSGDAGIVILISVSAHLKGTERFKYAQLLFSFCVYLDLL